MNTQLRITFSAALVTALVIGTFGGAADRSEKDGVVQGKVAGVATKTEPQLGLGVTPLPPALAAQLPDVIGRGRGVLVEKIMRDSPAERAGLTAAFVAGVAGHFGLLAG